MFYITWRSCRGAKHCFVESCQRPTKNIGRRKRKPFFFRFVNNIHSENREYISVLVVGVWYVVRFLECFWPTISTFYILLTYSSHLYDTRTVKSIVGRILADSWADWIVFHNFVSSSSIVWTKFNAIVIDTLETDFKSFHFQHFFKCKWFDYVAASMDTSFDF